MRKIIFLCADYVGFIKKIMKLLQKGYNEIQALEVELRILEQTSAPPSRPRKLPVFQDFPKNYRIFSFNEVPFFFFITFSIISYTTISPFHLDAKQIFLKKKTK